MPKMKVRGRWVNVKPRTPNNGLSQVVDKNEAFVMKAAAIYFFRFLTRYKKLDVETIEYARWVLGPELMHKAGAFLAATMEKPKQDDFLEELSECRMDPEEYGRTIWTALTRVHRTLLKHFVSILEEMAAERIATLKYRGKSELEVNADQMRKMFGLTALECDFLVLLYILTFSYEAEAFWVDHLHCHWMTRRRYLEIILETSRNEVNGLFSGALARLDILDSSERNLRLSNEFKRFFEGSTSKIAEENLFANANKADVPLEHHFVDKNQVSLLRELLSDKPDTGVHILLYGEPGTGKSCFAKALVSSIKSPSYEILQHSDNTAGLRRAGIQACLNMTNTEKGSIVIVDEADNLLNTHNSWFERGETQDKGWLNQLLEEPGLRIIWVTNRIDAIEPSVLRRFCFSLPFRPFSRRQRIRLWGNIIKRHRVKRHFRQEDVELLADVYKVSAGAIDLAVRKAKELKQPTAETFRGSVRMVLESHRTLLNDGYPVRVKETIPANYSLEGLNIDGDVIGLLDQLDAYSEYISFNRKHIPGINILFYGPSGTGKSALGRYVAHQLDRELIVKRSSDLLSKYVGGTERNLAKAFAEAEAVDAVLVIDEADSLLFGRDRAVRSWEISHTNEFLTQMEAFHGILICTTNRLPDLDAASIRRFGQKLEFKYLTPEGNVIFYNRLLAPLVGGHFSKNLLDDLKRLSNLAPGDFETVRRNSTFKRKGQISPGSLIDELKRESKVKQIIGEKKIHGFTG